MKQRGALRLTGHDKEAGKVYAQTKNGYIVRDAPRKGTHANDPNIKENSSSAGTINRLAGEVSRIINSYAKIDSSTKLYQAIKNRFFEVQHPHRFVWLSNLEGLDAHPQKLLHNAINTPVITVMQEAERLKVKATITGHAIFEKGFQLYSLHIILLYWNSDDNKARHTEKYTAWLDGSRALPLNYTFDFEKPPGMTDYLVLCCCLRSERENEKYKSIRALKVMSVGSYDEKSLAELTAYRDAKSKEGEHSNADEIMRDERLAQEPDEE